MKDWKKCGLRLAKLLGGERMPVTGRGRGDAPDIAHPIFSVEVKSRKTIPAWFEETLAQAGASALPAQLPVAVLHRDGDRYADALVVVRLKRFVLQLGEQ